MLHVCCTAQFVDCISHPLTKPDFFVWPMLSSFLAVDFSCSSIKRFHVYSFVLSDWLTNFAFKAHSKPGGLATAVEVKPSLGFVVSSCPFEKNASPVIEGKRGKTRSLLTPPSPLRARDVCLVSENPTCSVPALLGCEGLWS